MKSSIANRLSYIGAGIGLTLFAIFGLLYGSFLGGVIGLNIVNLLSGAPLASSIIARVIVALGMITGILLSCAIFVVGCGAVGWLIGTVIDPVTWSRKKALQEHEMNH
jgi:hypothetical protein